MLWKCEYCRNENDGSKCGECGYKRDGKNKEREREIVQSPRQSIDHHDKDVRQVASSSTDRRRESRSVEYYAKQPGTVDRYEREIVQSPRQSVDHRDYDVRQVASSNSDRRRESESIEYYAKQPATVDRYEPPLRRDEAPMRRESEGCFRREEYRYDDRYNPRREDDFRYGYGRPRHDEMARYPPAMERSASDSMNRGSVIQRESSGFGGVIRRESSVGVSTGVIQRQSSTIAMVDDRYAGRMSKSSTFEGEERGTSYDDRRRVDDRRFVEDDRRGRIDSYVPSYSRREVEEDRRAKPRDEPKEKKMTRADAIRKTVVALQRELAVVFMKDVKNKVVLSNVRETLVKGIEQADLIKAGVVEAAKAAVSKGGEDVEFEEDEEDILRKMLPKMLPSFKKKVVEKSVRAVVRAKKDERRKAESDESSEEESEESEEDVIEAPVRVKKGLVRKSSVVDIMGDEEMDVDEDTADQDEMEEAISKQAVQKIPKVKQPKVAKKAAIVKPSFVVPTIKEVVYSRRDFELSDSEEEEIEADDGFALGEGILKLVAGRGVEYVAKWRETGSGELFYMVDGEGDGKVPVTSELPLTIGKISR
jgi:hypothetical protein